jgi:hypothetical protein
VIRIEPRHPKLLSVTDRQKKQQIIRIGLAKIPNQNIIHLAASLQRFHVTFQPNITILLNQTLNMQSQTVTDPQHSQRLFLTATRLTQKIYAFSNQ